MRISDKTLGYLTFGVLILLLSWVSISMYIKSTSTVHQITLIFEDVGTLQPQDPVTKQGLIIGSVASVAYHDKSALVVISFDNPILLRDSSRFINYNYSLMGERRLKIIPSKKGSYIKPGQEIRGEFELGISEAMHKMQYLINEVKVIRDFLVLLNKGSETTPPLFELIYTELDKTEQMIDLFQREFQRLHPRLINVIHNTTQLSEKGIEIINTTDATISGLYVQAESLINKTHGVISGTAEVVDSLKQKLSAVENLDMLHNDSLFQSISTFVDALNATISTIQQSGLELTDAEGNKIGMFTLSNLNIFGDNAREKRAKRAVQEKK